ncbi:MAG: hypothetical protein KatS3mg033_2074 [Thermonema sp.]|uniref:hypothetical protein n=1 Tax=Thermonema sp. TaxID=2231181 RepID=UPI0021DD82C0|nr:hypothetical protein [Thermonema sp.]GIV40274.1 MAG: hypothetical protein KatS3mg033_2074 [Thermonema sp.]
MIPKEIQVKNKAVEKLFTTGYDVSPKMIEDLLHMEGIEEDLLRILQDAAARPRFYADLPLDGGRLAPVHAILLLRQMHSDHATRLVMELLQGDAYTMELLFGDTFMLEEMWPFITFSAKAHFRTYVDMLHKGDIDPFSKLAVSTGLAQAVFYEPGIAPKVETAFRELLELFIEKADDLQNDEAVFDGSDADSDIEFISNFALDVSDTGFESLRPLIEELIDLRIIDTDIVDEVDLDFKARKKEIHPILKVYETFRLENESEIEKATDSNEKIKKTKQADED